MIRKAIITFMLALAVLPLGAQKMKLSPKEVDILKKTQITGVDFRKIPMNYPRLVGYNSRKGVHGYGPTVQFFIIKSRNLKGLGAIGSRKQIQPDNLKEFRELYVGKKLADLLDPKTFLVKPEYRAGDIAIYDLVGVVLGKPFYKLFGKPAQSKVKVYSGMVYFEDYDGNVPVADRKAGLQRVIDACQYDWDFGYRQFKAKIGRGANWVPHDIGLKHDIEVLRTIHEHFPEAEILVDPNNGYSVQDCIDLIEGIRPAKLYWMEEPFDENEPQYAEFDAWRKVNAPEVITIDGEFEPKREVCFDLGRKGYLDAYCEDIIDFGFTEWIERIPMLREIGMIASPHAWGSAPKSIYAAQLALAFGNIPTVEGVTCFADDVDMDYKVKDGCYVPSKRPGFGIILK